ncbi:MAG: C10 family peptidase [Prevotella sp.]|nr:C10 family peptidase [Prevotella sp.]
MRKLITFFILLWAVVLHAQQITPDEAAAIASEFLSSSSPQLTTAKRVGVRRAKAKSDDVDNLPRPYYVFNSDDNQGFVIVAGSHGLGPILGYSDNGIFDFCNVPVQLQTMLNSVEAETTLNYMKERRTISKRTNRSLEGRILETALWGQSEPYNCMLPKMGEDRPVTGCTATAMSIIMKYHGYPEKGNRFLLCHDWETQKDYNLNLAETTFDWSNMLQSYSDENYSQQNAESVGILMKCAGFTIGSYYNINETGASVLNVSSALQRYFRYSSDIHEEARAGFGDEMWLSTIREEIDQNRPVLYYGSGNGAHAFVIDGYDAEGAVHINWGWDGVANGYFFLDALTPGNYDFSHDQGAIINIHPGEDADLLWSDCFLADSRIFPQLYSQEDFFTSVENIIPHELFDVSTPTITFPAGFKGQIGLALVDSNNKIKEIVHSGRNIENFFQDIVAVKGSFIGCAIKSSSIEFGDRLQLVTLDDGDKDWRMIKQRNNLKPNCDCDKLYAEFTNITWTIAPQLELIIGNEDGNCIYQYGKNNSNVPIKDKFIKGLYFSIRGEGADESHGNSTAIRINSELVNLCNDTYPALVWLQTSDDYLNIDILAHFKENDKMSMINCSTPGTLHDSFKGDNISDNVDITITGKINYEDLKFIRNNLMFVTKLDLSGCVLDTESGDETVIPEGCFYALSKLKNVSLPSNTDAIDPGAFADTELEYITLPASVKKIGLSAFQNCYGLAPKAVMVKSSNPPIFTGDIEYIFTKPDESILYVLPGCAENYKKDLNWNHFKEIVEAEDPLMEEVIVTVNGINYSLSYNHADISGWDEEAKTQEVVFEESVKFKGQKYPVTGILRRAFLYNENLKKVEIPECVVNWKDGAFSCCYNLEYVNIKSLITGFPSNCFEHNFSLKQIILPHTLKILNGGDIEGVDCLDEFEIPAQVDSISKTFGISSKKIVLSPENSAFKLHEGCLYTANMQRLIMTPQYSEDELSINIPEGVKYLNWHLFQNLPKGTKINLPSSLVELSFYGFARTSYQLEEFIIPDNVTGVSDLSIPLVKYLTIGNKIGAPHEDPHIIHASMNRAFMTWQGCESHVYLKNYSVIPLSDMLGENLNDTKIKFYSPYIYNNFLYDISKNQENIRFYLPGCVRDVQLDELKPLCFDMWQFRIDRNTGIVAIKPEIEGLTIDSVMINEQKVVPVHGFYYQYTFRENPDIVVNYTLHNRQAMSTHYTQEFIASLSNTNLVLPILAESITLSHENWNGEEGESFTLVATVLPETTTDKSITWSSSNEAVATVDANGKVTTVGIGEATITATAADGSGVSTTCQVTVNPIMVKSLTINPETWNGTEDESFQITAVVEPEDATDKTIAWGSSDKTVATVDATGYVNVLKGGNCIITASTQDGSSLSAECIITCVSGIDDIFTDADARFDVYNLQGILVKKDCSRDDLKQLSTGAYILRQGDVSRKIIIQ